MPYQVTEISGAPLKHVDEASSAALTRARSEAAAASSFHYFGVCQNRGTMNELKRIMGFRKKDSEGDILTDLLPSVCMRPWQWKGH